MRTMKILFKLMCISGLLLIVHPAFAAKHMSADEVKSLLVGQTMFGKDSGTSWTVTVNANNTISGTWGDDSQSGIYEIKDNGQYCRKWESWSKGQMSCFLIKKGKKGKYKAKLKSGPSRPFSFKMQE